IDYDSLVEDKRASPFHDGVHAVARIEWNWIRATSEEEALRLSSFRVQKFRNILDSGVIKVDELVTCLVGMNESGKTAILSALHRLNPVGEADFSEQQDYPRWLLSKDRRNDVVKDAVPIEATFSLNDDDHRAIEE